ncbi:MAG: hypothetical protein FJ403_09875 [Verrucomicrobia bacterium]|nr:hypothetical protein [Verrucomicrobiota bacterium]
MRKPRSKHTGYATEACLAGAAANAPIGIVARAATKCSLNNSRTKNKSANVKVSPVAGDGRVYFMNGEGNCVVVRASPKLEILATNELKETTLSTPAICRGRLFVRTDGNLYCVR